MNALEIVAVSVAPVFLTFFCASRHLLAHYRRTPIALFGGSTRARTETEVQGSAFFWALAWALCWPFTLVFLLALRPSRTQRKELARLRTLEVIRQQERHLGLGP